MHIIMTEKELKKSDNGTVTNYFYQGEVVLYTTDESGNVTARSNSEPVTSTGFPECMRLYGKQLEESKKDRTTN